MGTSGGTGRNDGEDGAVMCWHCFALGFITSDALTCLMFLVEAALGHPK